MTISKTTPTAIPAMAPVDSPEFELESTRAFEVSSESPGEVEEDIAEDVTPDSLGSPVRVAVLDLEDELELLVLTTALPKVGSDTSPLTDQILAVELGQPSVVVTVLIS